MNKKLTKSLETYLLAIDTLLNKNNSIIVKDVAQYLNIGAASTAEAVKKLKKKGFINYEPYGNITLTPLGKDTIYIKKYRHKTITDFLNHFDYEVLEVNDSLKPYIKNGYVDEFTNPELVKAARFYPHVTKGEGQFVCILKKKGNLVKNKIEFKTNDLIDKYIKDDINIKLNTEIFNDRFYHKVPFDINNLKIISSGVKLGELKNGRFIYHHNFATAFGLYFKNKLNLTLNDERLIKYLKGYEIEDAKVLNGYGVILVDSYPLGLFKASNGILKNHYPNGLRMD